MDETLFYSGPVLIWSTSFWNEAAISARSMAGGCTSQTTLAKHLGFQIYYLYSYLKKKRFWNKKAGKNCKSFERRLYPDSYFLIFAHPDCRLHISILFSVTKFSSLKRTSLKQAFEITRITNFEVVIWSLKREKWSHSFSYTFFFC